MNNDITLVKNVSIGWNPCTEDCYPVDNDGIVIIAYWNGDKWQNWLYEDCPFGWNVLCRNEAYWKTITNPYR